MSLDRFFNKGQLLSLNRSANGQIWSNDDLSLLDETILVPTDPNITNGQVSEVHILSFYGDYILGNHDAGYTIHDQASNSLLIDIGKVLSGENERTNDERSNVLEDAVAALNLTEKQLEKCVGKNIRITVRRIMKLKYSSPPAGFKFADVDEEHVSAARGKNFFLCIQKTKDTIYV